MWNKSGLSCLPRLAWQPLLWLLLQIQTTMEEEEDTKGNSASPASAQDKAHSCLSESANCCVGKEKKIPKSPFGDVILLMLNNLTPAPKN